MKYYLKAVLFFFLLTINDAFIKEINEKVRVCSTCGNPICSHNDAEKYFSEDKDKEVKK